MAFLVWPRKSSKKRLWALSCALRKRASLPKSGIFLSQRYSHNENRYFIINNLFTFFTWSKPFTQIRMLFLCHSFHCSSKKGIKGFVFLAKTRWNKFRSKSYIEQNWMVRSFVITLQQKFSTICAWSIVLVDIILFVAWSMLYLWNESCWPSLHCETSEFRERML